MTATGPATAPAVAPAGTEAVLDARRIVAQHGKNRVVDGVDLRIGRGEFVTLLGPSGCGKTTTLRCVAGLHRVTDGSITLGGRVVADRRTHVRPERRSVNMVFQSYALWPHMTVYQNVAYGLRAQRLPKEEITERTNEMLETVGLGGYGSRSATSLSGGQQQRVVLARGLVTQSKLLLLDEPLSNLDTELRVRMRTEIHALQRRLGLTMLYVTHDRTEALALSDRVIVMRNGTAQQAGSPAELYAAPRNRFVAEALGPVNVLPAEIVERGADTAAVLTSADNRPVLRVAPPTDGRDVAVGQRIDILVRPEALTLGAATDDNGSGGIDATVELVEFLGNRTEVTCRSAEVSFIVEIPRAARTLRPGDKVVARLHEGKDDAPPAWQQHRSD
ncbi:ABC transporter ATP-binding protein [Streptomyces sp. NPDC023723]|uniref:ABC transporter ATP-binding protein n=1 Tax=Streptomyces sp. NPDC023723 TaxID=3154323 RepID=UPI0033FA41C8